MEIKGKQKTLVGIFLQFALLFCVNTIGIVAVSFLMLVFSTYLGLTLPSNYQESLLTEHAPQLAAAGEAVEPWIPAGCTYGIYSADGRWRAGTLAAQEREDAWISFTKKNSYAGGAYYRFILQDAGTVCIVKYELYMRYRWEKLNQILPAPELMSFGLDGLLFLLNAVLLSRYFARKLKQQLAVLQNVTDKIAANDLQFEAASSELREFNTVMASLTRMKEALQASLKKQWDMEQGKKEQLAALTHDVKTPLTVIKGNAELLLEEKLSEENQECVAYILSNTAEIERYLEHIREVLDGRQMQQEITCISCRELGQIYKQAALELAGAEKMAVAFRLEVPEGRICCNQTKLCRAWGNLLRNGIEHTDPQKGLVVQLQKCYFERKAYLAATVRDYGAGFSPRDLQYADREFYSGDESRHDRSHQGLGLAIARQFVTEQGGFLQFGNHEDGGAVVTLWIRLAKEASLS